jgi:hypothetical protein
MAVPLVVAALFTNLAGNAVNLYGAPPIVSQAVPALLVAPVWYAWFASGRKLVWTPALSMMLAFVFVNLIGVFFSADPDSAMQAVIALIAEGFAVLFLLVNAIRSREALRLALMALVASAALVGAVALFQQLTGTYYTRYFGLAQLSDDAFATGEETLTGDVLQLRLGGMIGEKNYFAQFMLMVIPIGAALAATQSSLTRKAALIIGSMLIGVGVVLTFSRGAAVAAAALVATAVVLRLVAPRFVLVGALCLGVLVVGFPQYVTRISTIAAVADLSPDASSDLSDSALRGRAAENAAALLAFAEHPLIGLGPGQFPSSYTTYARKAGVEDLHATDRRAHSLFLAMLAEVGILGTAVFLGILAAIAIPLVRIRRRAQDPVDALIATGLLLGILAFLFAGAFLDLAYARYFWLLLGLAAAAGTVLAPDPVSAGVSAVAYPEVLMLPSSWVRPRPSRLRGGGPDRWLSSSYPDDDPTHRAPRALRQNDDAIPQSESPRNRGPSIQR